MFIGRSSGKLRDSYRIGKKIGEGNLAKIDRCVGKLGEMRLVMHKETQVQRAIKVIRKNRLNIKEREAMQLEYSIVKQLVSRLGLLLLGSSECYAFVRVF